MAKYKVTLTAAEKDEMITEQVNVSVSTVHRTRQYFVDYGLDVALHDDPRSGQPRKLDANQEALMIARCCTEPPQGRCRWT